MPPHPHRWLVVSAAIVLSLTACDGEHDEDGGTDAGVLAIDGSADAGTPTNDAGTDAHVGAELDGGPDAGPTDAGPTDAGPTDAGPTDAGPPMRTLRVELLGDGAGRVDGDGIACFLGASARCAIEVPEGTELALTAAADTGSTLDGWDAPGCTGSSCTVRVDHDLVVSVAFTAVVPTLTVRLDGAGTGTVTASGIDCGDDCVEVYPYGAEVTLTAIADAGSALTGWGGACAGSSETCTITMTGAEEVTATFMSTSATLRVEASGGRAIVRSDPAGLDCAPPCEATFPIGTRVTLTATPPYRTSLDAWDPIALGCAGAAPCTVDVEADRTVTLELHEHPYVQLSDTDRDPRLILRDDGLAADFWSNDAVRSAQSVAPGSGVYYFEAHLLVPDRGEYGFGVATASTPLTATHVGDDDQCFGVASDGSVFYDNTWLARVGGGTDRFGLVVDYRGSSPVVYLVASPDGVSSEIVYTEALPAITTPVYIFLSGSKRTPGWDIEINPGNDTTVSPFFLDPESALRAGGDDAVADALTLGWDDPYAGPPDAPPTITVSADQIVSAGTSVTVTASAIDPEDGDLGASIEWELLSSPHYAGRVTGSGETFTFTPTAVGLHPARALVRDHADHIVEAAVRVRVPGPVAQHDPVRLEHDARSSSGAELSPDDLAARFTDLGKYGVRANQSLYGETGYFEIHRLVGPLNIGGGLVTGDGDIAPYSWSDVPGSCSVNMEGGVWRDLMWESDFPGPASAYDTFGFAVDYRGEHPIVYVITQNEVIAELVLDDVWTEVYPMIYGNPTDVTVAGEYDEGIDFGAAPFAYDPVAALAAYGVDTTGFSTGWGHAITMP